MGCAKVSYRSVKPVFNARFNIPLRCSVAMIDSSLQRWLAQQRRSIVLRLWQRRFGESEEDSSERSMGRQLAPPDL